MRLFALSGSLRAGSTHGVLLRAAELLAPAGTVFDLYGELESIPPFNPDRDIDPPPAAVADFRARLRACDGVLISSPEYIHGVPGVLKNALDWTASSGEFVGKPVALLDAATRGEHARASLLETLRVLTARIVAEAALAVDFPRREATAEEIAGDPELAGKIRAALAAFARAVEAALGES